MHCRLIGSQDNMRLNRSDASPDLTVFDKAQSCSSLEREREREKKGGGGGGEKERERGRR